jgi:threonyl-tRNA synthetase
MVQESVMAKDKQPDLEAMRHTAAHLLAAASRQLKPETRLGVGPAVENGFYHDIDVDERYTDEDLPRLQAEMEKIKEKDLPITHRAVSKDEARKIFADDPFKLELIDELPEDEVGISDMGNGFFITLCKGGHVESTGHVGYFQLTHLAGAYWKGDEKRQQLQRIYGLLFPTQKELEAYVEQQTEAKKRDHKKLGKELDLFFFADLVGSGLPLWTEKGAAIRRELERFITDEEIKRGYKHVITPDLARTALYEQSGHYPYYADSMYPVLEIEKDKFVLRPMTCPHHFMVYEHRPRSYKELPLRIAEIAKLYRYEQSGELSGLQRVRSFSLADSHIFCRKDQASDEIKQVIDLIEYAAGILGLKQGEDYWYRLSLGDRNNKEKYYDDPEHWVESELVLRQVLTELNAPFTEAPNEAAFYGPKIDVQMRNVNSKEDTAFTIQYDFCLPARFKLEYINENGKTEQPVVIHRSSIGAIERTVAFLIERYAGAFPLWLSPVQVKILPIADGQYDYAQQVAQQLREQNIRVEVDTRSESIGKKIREAEMEKVPVMFIIGKKEAEASTVSMRTRADGDKGAKKIDEVIAELKDQITRRT